MSTGNTMVHNFVNKYRISGLQRIIELFRQHISNQTIAQEFNVTRQRVHQWQREFTKIQVIPTEPVKKVLHLKSQIK